jgi:hypothetical protein
VNDARGVRFRVVKSGVNPTLVHDNLIDNIQNGSSGSYVAAFHLCDPDSGTDDGSTYNIYSNTLRFAGGASGNGLMARGCTGFPIFQNNTIVCISGSCDGMLTNNRQGYGPGTLAIMNNDPVPLASNPQNNVESGNTTNYCSSGSMGGTGTATSITCP